MASRSDVERLVSANRGVSELVRKTLDDLWASLDLAKPEKARTILYDELPTLVAQYGDVAATVAADWYDDVRAESAAVGRFSAFLAENTPAVKVESQVRFGAQHLFGDEPSRTRDFLALALDRYVLQSGRDTIMNSARRDPGNPRFARVPSSTSSCKFCRMLGSRGAVYASAASAGEMRKYHGNCHCTPTPIWPNDPLPKGYDPDALYAEYLADGKF